MARNGSSQPTPTNSPESSARRSPTSSRRCKSWNSPPELRQAFADELQALQELSVSRGPTRGPLVKPSGDSLASLLRDGRPVDPQRAAKLQLALCTRIAGDLSFATADDSGDYATAAREMTGHPGTKLVIMGHTHLARDISFPASGGRYFNTGTWADLLRADEAVLTDRSPDRAVFLAWLRKLATNDLGDLRICRPGFADVTVGDAGSIVGEPRLRIHTSGTPL